MSWISQVLYLQRSLCCIAVNQSVFKVLNRYCKIFMNKPHIFNRYLLICIPCITVSIQHGSTSFCRVEGFKIVSKIYCAYSSYLFKRDNKMSGRFVVMPSTPILMSFFISDLVSGVQTTTLIPVAWAFFDYF